MPIIMNLDTIERTARELLEEVRLAPGTILTEDDLKCLLFSRFARIPEFRGPKPTSDPHVRASVVHSEITWFDEHNRLALKPDLTITDPTFLSIFRPLQSGIPFPSKGAHFTGNSVAVELKFYHGRKGIPPRAMVSIRRDVEKLQKLISKNAASAPDRVFLGFVIVVSRYSGWPPELDLLIQEHNDHRVRVIVESLDVQPLNRDSLRSLQLGM